MNRKEFFKKLGIGVAAAIVAPKVIAEIKPNNTIIWDEEALMPKDFESIAIAPEQDGYANVGWFYPKRGYEITNRRFLGIAYFDSTGKCRKIDILKD